MVKRLILCVLGLTLCSPWAVGIEKGIDPGRLYPDFTLPRVDTDRAVSLEDYRGRRVLLIHFASWSEDCRRSVPAWYEAAKASRKKGQLEVIGVVQEQHADRARLFAQWKKLDFPILYDPVNSLPVEAVPTVVAIDEYGVVQPSPDKPGKLKAAFLAKEFKKPDDLPKSDPGPAATDYDALLKAANDKPTLGTVLRAGDSLLLWGGRDGLNKAMKAYQRVTMLKPETGQGLFRMGVATLMRYESPDRQFGDLQRALQYWAAAVRYNPNQAVWHSRLQQYGAKTDKPHSFYAWVATAREEIAARGETPVSLGVEPGGAELADPASVFTPDETAAVNPDPEKKIHADQLGFIVADPAVVPFPVKPGDIAAVNVLFRPRRGFASQWANEAEPLKVWIDPPDGWQVDKKVFTVPSGSPAVGDEVRPVYFDVKLPPGIEPGDYVIRGTALYYASEARSAESLYFRKDLKIPVKVQAKE